MEPKIRHSVAPSVDFYASYRPPLRRISKRRHLTRVARLCVGCTGRPFAVISAELHSGPERSSRAYDTMQLTRQALDAVVARIQGVSLLSSRIQKDEHGYSMRSSMADFSKCNQDNICWDFVRMGYCPRHGHCRWYHPQDWDTARIKVVIRYKKEAGESEIERRAIQPSAGRQKLVLGDLIQ